RRNPWRRKIRCLGASRLWHWRGGGRVSGAEPARRRRHTRSGAGKVSCLAGTGNRRAARPQSVSRRARQFARRGSPRRQASDGTAADTHRIETASPPGQSMKIRRALPSLVLVFCFCARAFVVDLNSTGDPLRWHLNPLEPSDPPNAGGVHTNVVNPVTGAIRFFLASDGLSNTNTVAELNAVRASFAQWQSITGTVLKFEDAGVVAPGVDINTSDNQNVVFWAKNSTTVNGGMDNISGALGVTFNSWFPDNNAQAEADIVFNGVQYSWFTDFNNTNASGTQIFVESTALHEIGHFLGLKHSPVGGATMLFRGSGGVNAQAGLSSDEVAAVQWLYGTSGTITTLGHLQGQVTMNGSAVFGAVVLAEEASTGNLAAGTVTHTNGSYDLPAMPPGQYRVRVTPLDPVGAADFLIRGRDVSNEKDAAGNFIFDAVQTAFLPSNDADITLAAGTALTQNFTVTSGSPAFRITQIRTPSNNSGSFNWSS